MKKNLYFSSAYFVIGKAASVSVPKEKSTWKVVFWEVLKLIKQIS